LNRICRFCRCDISKLHHNARTCNSEVCQEKLKAANKKRAKEVSENYRKRKEELIGLDPEVRICNNCRNPIDNGNWKLCRLCHKSLTETKCRNGEYLYL